MPGVAVGAMAASVALLVPVRADPRRAAAGDPRPDGPAAAPARSRAGGLLALVGLGAGAGVVGPGVVGWLWLLTAVAVTLGVRRLLRWRGLARQRAATAAAVLGVCEHLAGELGAGAPPGDALRSAVTLWPPLRTVAEAERLGTSVPRAWAALAAHPGAEGLRLVAAGWVVAGHTGQGLADVLARVLGDLAEDAETARVVTGELASARATARLMAALPLLVLALAGLAGGAPWAFFASGVAGGGVLLVGVLLELLGLTWIERIAAGAVR